MGIWPADNSSSLSPVKVTNMQPAIIVVSDDGHGAADLAARLKQAGYAARAVPASGFRQREHSGEVADLALVDLGPGGVRVADSLNGYGVPVVYLVNGAGPHPEMLRRARETRPFGYLAKPVSTVQLRLGVESALSLHRREREREEAERRLARETEGIRSRERLLTTVLDNVAGGVVAADEKGDYVFTNAGVRKILGIDLPRVEMERRVTELGLYRPDGQTPMPIEEMPLPRALRGEETDDVQVFVRNTHWPDGRYVSISGRPAEFGDGKRGAVLVFRDVTRSQQESDRATALTRNLAEQTKLLNTVLHSMSEGVLVASSEGRLLYINRSGESILGKQLMDDLAPSEWAATYGLFHLDRRTMISTEDLPLMRALRGKETVDEQEYFIRNDRRPEGVYVSATAVPLRNGKEDVLGAVAIFRDITRQKEAEEELRRTLRDTQEHDNLMKTVFESMSDGVVVADSAGNFRLFNPAAEAIIGVGMVEVPPDQWTERYGLFEPDGKTHLPTEELPLVRAINGKRTIDAEVFVRNEQRPDGVYIVVNAEPLPGDGGGLAVFRDVTEQRRSERARIRAMHELREQTELMETVFDSVDDAIVAVDGSGTVVHVNRAAGSLSMIDESGAPLSVRSESVRFLYPDGITTVEDADLPILRAALKGEVVNDQDFVMVTESRREGMMLRVSARPLMASDGSRRGGVAIVRDVTEARQAEDALAQAFSQGKIEIIDTILHNIGNAINSVATGIDTIDRLLADDTLTQRLRSLVNALDAHRDDWTDYIENDPQGRLVLPFVMALGRDLVRRDAKILKAAQRAKSRSEHITEIIRTQGALKNQSMLTKEVDLEGTLMASVGLLEYTLRGLGIQVDIRCDGVPKVIKTQESDFQQMLVNLIRNSIDALMARKAGAPSEWEPRIRIRSYVRHPHLVIDVVDNGIGIRPDDLQTIFRAGVSTKEDGTGLGLHSAAIFVERSGGRIQAISEGIGHGATMRIEMRLLSLGVSERDTPRGGRDPSAAADGESGR